MWSYTLGRPNKALDEFAPAQGGAETDGSLHGWL